MAKLPTEKILRYESKDGLHVTVTYVGELVRCKECKYSETIIYRGEPTLTCNNNEGLFRDVPCDGFCYVGDRK